MWAATGLLRQILKDNDKVIVEETAQKALLVHDTDNDESDKNEDVDQDAHMYPLS